MALVVVVVDVSWDMGSHASLDMGMVVGGGVYVPLPYVNTSNWDWDRPSRADNPGPLAAHGPELYIPGILDLRR